MRIAIARGGVVTNIVTVPDGWSVAKGGKSVAGPATVETRGIDPAPGRAGEVVTHRVDAADGETLFVSETAQIGDIKFGDGWQPPPDRIIPPEVPAVEMWRFRLALRRAGLFDAWGAAVAAAKEKDAAWAAGAPEVSATNSKLARIAAAAGIGEDSLASVLRSAAAL